MTTNAARPAFQSLGFWLAIPLAALQALNVFRAVHDPAGFAVYFGAPLAAPADAAWVFVYAARTLFITLLATGFLIRGNLSALAWTTIAALVMPLGDLYVAHAAGAPMGTLLRHAAIFLYLVVAAIALMAAARSRARS